VGSAKEADFWLNEKSGMQAMLEKRGSGNYGLTFLPFIPLKKILGTDKGGFGFETKPLLKMKEEDLLKEYAAFDLEKKSPEKISLNLPPFEYRSNPTWISVTLAKGKVKKYQFTVYYGAHDSMKPAIEEALKEKFKKTAKAKAMYTQLSKKPPIKLGHSETTQQFTFWAGK
jgi:hypothetical protein